jgi:hypothetical protein
MLPDEQTGVEKMSEHMNGEKYNWPRFCKVLGEKGPDLLIGVEKNVIDSFIRNQAKSTDEFLSYDMEYVLSEAAAEGDLERGVIAALEEWKENIIANYFDFGTGLGDGIQNIEIDLESKIIDELVEAAKPS